MTAEEVEAAARVLRSGRLVQGEEVRLFEEELAAYTGAAHAVMVNSGTAALHVALLALGVGPGVDVVVPDFTFPATGNAVFLTGAIPVLADVDPATLAVTAEELERRVTPRTRVVMPVHPFGLPADMKAINEMAEEARVSVLEDAAAALGSRIDDRSCGTFGRIGCFSFHPRKSLTTGEGGAIVTDDEKLAELARRYRNHGSVPEGRRLRFELAGLNYRMPEVAAAVGRVQLRRLPQDLERKRALVARYRDRLASVAEVRFPPEADGVYHSYQSLVLRLAPDVARDEVIDAMAAREVETTIGTYALHGQPLYRHRLGSREGDYAVSWAAYRDTLAVPLYPRMTEADVDRVADALKDAVAASRAA